MKTHNLQKTVNNFLSDIKQVEGSPQGQADCLILLAGQLDAALKSMVNELDGDGQLFENCCHLTMEMALQNVLMEPDVDMHWRLVDGVDVYT